jgi:transcriptional regulator with XRE-family HTH domain
MGIGLFGSREIGDRLRRSRAHAGVSVRLAADCAGVTEDYFGAVEAGRGKLTFLQLEALAETYGTAVERLLGHAVFDANVARPGEVSGRPRRGGAAA